MTYCLDCKRDVFGDFKESCKDAGHDLDYEGLTGPARTKKEMGILKTKKLDLVDMATQFLDNTYVRTILEDKQMWYWDKVGLVWRPEGESYLMAWVNEKYPDLSRNDFYEMRFHVQKKTVITREQFRPNEYYLNFNGKELNLRTLVDEGRVNWENFSRTKLSTNLDLKAGQPWEFLKALHLAIPDNRDMFHCLQAFSSILLVKTMRIEKAFFFLGSGGNGKSTIMKAVENIFENYIAHVDLADLVKDRFSSAILVDKLANVYADIQSLKFKDMAIFKAISSGDTISVALKYENRHDETIKVIQIYSANKMPFVEDKNQGFLRRVSPVVFDMEIKNTDPYIDDKLYGERKQILALLVKVARFTRDHGFIYDKTKDEIVRILEDKEDPITQFINDPDWNKTGTEYEIEHSLEYKKYMDYCKLIGCVPKTMNAFSRYLTNRGFTTRKSNSKRFWQGIGWDTLKGLDAHVD